MSKRYIDADAAVSNADARYGEWVLAMAAAEGSQVNMVYKKQELFKAVKKVIESCPSIDPDSLRPVSEWELNPHRFSCEHFRCKECHHIDCVADNYCGKCGARMKNAGVKPEDLPVPEEENSSAEKSDDENGEWGWKECGGTVIAEVRTNGDS